LIDMPVYLAYQRDRLLATVAPIEQGRVTDLDGPALGRTVVNGTGLSARTLVADHDLQPIRGKHVVVTNPGITDSFSEDTGTSPDLLCIYPNGNTSSSGAPPSTVRATSTRARPPPTPSSAAASP
jgi:D-amino-acid oxidase